MKSIVFPAILFLDESTTGLDAKTAFQSYIILQVIELAYYA